MSKGDSGHFSGTGGGSQPYAETYSVISHEMQKDKKDADIYNSKTGYFKNPTAVSIENAIQGNRILIDGKRPDGPLTYVMNKSGNIIIGKRNNPNNPKKRSPHPTLIGGKNPKVQCAGMIHFHKGKIKSVDNHSGHFRPNKKSMEKVEKALNNLYQKHPEVFDKKWRE